MSKNIDNKRKDDEFIEKNNEKKWKIEKKSWCWRAFGDKINFCCKDYIVYLEYKCSCYLMICALYPRLYPLIQSNVDNRNRRISFLKWT